MQVFFPDGRPARGAQVEVMQPDGATFATGQTGPDGRFTCVPEGPGGVWKLQVRAGMGHATEAEFRLGGSGGAEMEPAGDDASGEEPLVRVKSPLVGILAGLGFVFGLSAFLMVLKLRAQLRHLRED